MRFPGWIPTIAAVAGVALTLSAAHWQFGRAAFKTGLQHEYEVRQALPPLDLNAGIAPPEDMQYRKVQVAGTYLASNAIFLDNRIRSGRAGYEYVVPMRIGNSDRFVLVNRGWLPGGQTRNQLPNIKLPAGMVSVTGNAVAAGSPALELSSQTVEGRVWQNLDLARYRQQQGLDVLGFVIHEESAADDGFDRNWLPPGFGVQTHQSYALQWLAFAGMIMFFYVYYGFIRKKPADEK